MPTVASSTVTCPNWTIDTTTDSSLQSATYKGVLTDAKKAPVQTVFEKYSFSPDWGSTVSWTQVEMYNQSVLVTLPTTYYTKTQVDILIADLVTAGDLTSATAALSSGQLTQVNGLITTATASLTGGQTTQVNNLIATAVTGLATATDARFEREITKDYSSSFATANSSIGSVTPTVLSVNAPITVNSTVSVNSNICVKFGDDGALTVATGVTLTINCMVDPGNRKVFTSSATNAKVLFGKGAVEKIRIGWWTGATSGATVTDPLGEALESANANQTPIHFSQGTWATSGDHLIDEGVTIEGEGNHLISNLGTVIKLTSPTADALFKIGEINYSVRFKDIILSGDGTSGKYGVEYRGTYPNSSGDVHFDKVTFESFAVGLYYHDLGGDWQMAQTQIDHSVFWNNTVSIKTESLNSAFTVNSSNFYIADNQTAFLTDGIGITTVTGCEFAGMVPAAGAVNRKVFVINGAHVNINLISNQDEGNTHFLENNASDITGMVKLEGNLIQSQIYVNQSMNLTMEDNNVPPDCVRFGVGAVPHVSGTFNNVRTDIGTLEDPATIPANPLRMVKTNDPLTQLEFNPILGVSDWRRGAFTVRQYSRFIFPSYLEGFAANPVVSIMHGSSISESKVLLRLGRVDYTNTNTDEFYYDFWRQNSGSSAGRLQIRGNQTGFAGFDLQNGDLYVEGAVRTQTCNYTSGTATVLFDPRCGNTLYATLNQNTSITMPAMSSYDRGRSDGMRLTLEIIQDATGSRACNLATGSAGQFAFGTDITSVTCTTTANKRDILTVVYSNRSDRWNVVDFKKGFE